MKRDEVKRTYSPFALLALFAVVGAVGGTLILLWGTIERTPTALRDQGGATQQTSTSTTTEPEGASAVSLTFPDGTPTPERIEEVRARPGRRTYSYSVPDELSGPDSDTAVASAMLEPANEGAAVTVTVTCAVSTGSVPSEITVVEDPLEVRVTAVASGLRFGSPCTPLDVIEQITIPLDSPIGDRRLNTTPAGTPLD